MAETKKASTKKLNKFLKQETYTSKAGNKYILSYPGTFRAQKNIIDYSMMPNGQQSQLRFVSALLDNILQGDYGFDYWDKQIKDDDKTESIKVKDFNGKDVEYKFTFPGFKKMAEINEQSTDDNGALSTSNYYESLMSSVITSPKVNYKYWDQHDGYADVMSEADAFLGNIVSNSEYTEVVNAATEFLGKMFR